MELEVKQIPSNQTYDWLLNKHYAKRIPSITYAFGLFIDKKLVGVCTFGSPPSNALCRGICGDGYADIVFELNRLCIEEPMPPNTASLFVAKALSLLPKPRIIVSYADTSMGHIGVIYQATNWIYTGLSAKRTERRLKGSNKHSKTITEKYGMEYILNNPHLFEVVERPQKHRYLFFLGSKVEKKRMMKELRYTIQPYPKGETQRYNAEYKPSVTNSLF